MANDTDEKFIENVKDEINKKGKIMGIETEKTWLEQSFQVSKVQEETRLKFSKTLSNDEIKNKLVLSFILLSKYKRIIDEKNKKSGIFSKLFESLKIENNNVNDKNIRSKFANLTK